MPAKRNSPKGIVQLHYQELVIGRLAITPELLCAFEYDADFLQRGFSISPFQLPLQPGVFISKREPFEGLFGVFNDSLPDGWGLLLMDRLLRKNGIAPASLNPLDRLCLVGEQGMGALTYKPIMPLLKDFDVTDVAMLAAEVSKVLSEDASAQLELLAVKNASSAGARPKVMLELEGQHWLIKFPSASDLPEIGHIEMAYAAAARKCGIEMPETRLFEGRYFGVQRFDRKDNKRIHVLSASGLLNASHRYPSLDYTELLKACWLLTSDIQEVGKLYRQMIFNVLAHNRDDHAKNFSFILTPNGWKLSPAYDLVRSEGFNGQHTTTINGKGSPNKDDILDVAKNIGFPLAKARMIYDEAFNGTQDIRAL